MNKIGVNILLWVLFSLMQSGPIVGTIEYCETGSLLRTFSLMLPFSLLNLVLVVITTCYAVPYLLLQRKYGQYVTLEFGMSYFVSLIEQLIIVYFWVRLGIMPVEQIINWGWLAVNALCNSLVLFFTLLAVGFWNLFDAARFSLKKEQDLTRRIGDYLDTVRIILRPEALSNCLERIANEVETAPEDAEKDINELASELRKNLYGLPRFPILDKEMIGEDISNRKLDRWLTSSRYHLARVILFQLSLLCICFGVFFATPDQPEFNGRLGGFVILLALFEIIAAVEKFIFYKTFRKHRKRGRFISSAILLSLIIILPILVERIRLYIENPLGNDILFILTTLFSSLATILMIVFYIAGVGSILLYQDWVRQNIKITRLQGATKRIEYTNLKKQINPHFLFNVLNNAAILTSLDASEARKMLLELRRLIDYQFVESERDKVRLSETISFLKAYLKLETSRKDNLRFDIYCGGEAEGMVVPSLIFIPFVENAVKYSSAKTEEEMVKVRFEIRGSRLFFECENSVESSTHRSSILSPRESNPEAGGLGIANTLRRLELLYDNEFSYKVSRDGGVYRVSLEIPLSDNRQEENNHA